MSQNEGLAFSQHPFPLQQEDIMQEYVISRYDSEANSQTQEPRHHRKRTYPQSPNYRRLVNFEQLEETEIVENFATQIQEHELDISKIMPSNIASLIEKKDRLPCLLSKLKSRGNAQEYPFTHQTTQSHLVEPEKLSCVLELEDWKARFQAENEQVVKHRSHIEELEQEIESLRKNQFRTEQLQISVCNPIKQGPVHPQQGESDRQELQTRCLLEKESVIIQHESELKAQQQSNKEKISQLLGQIFVLETTHTQQIKCMSQSLQKERDKARILQLENNHLVQQKRVIQSQLREKLKDLQQQYNQRIEAADLQNYALNKQVANLQALLQSNQKDCHDKILSLQSNEQAYQIQDEVNNKIAQYQTLISEMESKESGWKFAIEQLQLQLHRKCLKIQELEIMVKSNQLQQARSQILKLQTENQRLNTAKDALQRDVQIYQKSIQDISILYQNKEKQLATIKAISQASIQQKDQENAHLREQLERKDGVIELLIEEKEDLIIELEKIQKKRKELQTTLGLHISKSSHREASQMEIRIKADSLESKADKLQKEVARLNKQIKQCKKAARIENQRLNQLLDARKSEMEQVLFLNERLKSQADPEVSSISQLSRSIMKIQGQKSKAVKEKCLSEFFEKLNCYKKTLTEYQTLQLKNQIAFILS